jgi:hypothetical protein
MKMTNADGRSNALSKLSQEVFGDERFESVKTNVGIVATRWLLERPMIFKANIAQAHGRKASWAPGFGVKIGDAVEASCSAYPYFNKKTVVTEKGDRVELIDGGFCANNPTLYAIADAVGPMDVPPANIRVVSLGVGTYPPPKVSHLTWDYWKSQTPGVHLLQKTLEINTQSMDQLRTILFKQIPTVRISQTFSEPTMATDLFEHNPKKLNELLQHGVHSFAEHEELLKSYLLWRCRMAIPEAQLDTWATPGAKVTSASTYQSIRGVLNDENSPYYAHLYSIFLQGSYGNDTNVFRESDVDIVVKLSKTYFYDDSRLTAGAKENFKRAFSPATVSYEGFKADVLAWLKKNYGASVDGGTKAIFIEGEGNRRDADVLVCANYRRYRKESNGVDDLYDEGVQFKKLDGTWIHNFPKQHSENCTAKHQATNSWFKPVVRIFKNMRNSMVVDEVIKSGVAPSYFIEGMLSNVPNELFVASYEDTFIKAYNWLMKTDQTQLTCASGLHWLARDNEPTSWPIANKDEFLAAAAKYWNEWGK